MLGNNVGHVAVFVFLIKYLEATSSALARGLTSDGTDTPCGGDAHPRISGSQATNQCRCSIHSRPIIEDGFLSYSAQYRLLKGFIC